VGVGKDSFEEGKGVALVRAMGTGSIKGRRSSHALYRQVKQQ